MSLILCFLFLFGIKILNFFSLLLELKSPILSMNSLFSSPSTPSKKGFILVNYIHSKINSNKIPRTYFKP